MLYLCCHHALRGLSIMSDGFAAAFAGIGVPSQCVIIGADPLSFLLRRVLPSQWVSRVEARTMHPRWQRRLLGRIRQDDMVWIYTDGALIHPTRDTSFETAIQRRGARYVFQLPDAWPLRTPFMQEACRRRVGLADLTAAVTPQLTELLRSSFPAMPLETCEEAADTDAYRACEVPRSPDPGSRVVVWSGPSPWKSDLDWLYPILERVHRRVPLTLRLITGSTRPTMNPPVPWEWRPFDKERQAEDYRDADAAVAYYRDFPYGRCKGNFKIKTYMAAGRATVTSPVGYNLNLIDNGVNGLLASTPEEWEEALVKVLTDHELAVRLGQQARRTAVERYSYKALAPVYSEILRRRFPECFL